MDRFNQADLTVALVADPNGALVYYADFKSEYDTQRTRIVELEAETGQLRESLARAAQFAERVTREVTDVTARLREVRESLTA